MNLSEDVLVTFTLKNSCFQGNAMSDEGRCMSFSESSEDKHSVSFNITLENVEFSDNKFSSKGLVFLDMENGKPGNQPSESEVYKKQCIAAPKRFWKWRSQ